MFGKKQFFLIIRTEVTIDGTVADFGAIVCDKQGNIYAECAVLVTEEYGVKSLFYDVNATDIWGLSGRDSRQQHYEEMLVAGARFLSGYGGINRWLSRAFAKYHPDLVAYDLACELNKLNKTGIDVNEFVNRFCLHDATDAHFAQSKKYKAFIENDPFGYSAQDSNLIIMASFTSGKKLLPEQNTSVEDIKLYDLPILAAIVKQKKWQGIIFAYCGEAGLHLPKFQKIVSETNVKKLARQINPIFEAASKKTLPMRLAVLAELPDEAIQRALAKNRLTPTEILEKLCLSRDLDTCVAVACNPSTSTALLEKLAENEDRERVLIKIAANQNTSTDVLEKLAIDIDKRSKFFRMRLANNPNTLPKRLEKLAEDRFAEVRIIVASNPNTPAAALRKLAMDAGNFWFKKARFSIKESVAANKNTPVAILKILAVDVDCEVRATVSENSNIPLCVREKLVRDGDIFGYAKTLSKRSNTPVKLRKKELAQLATSKYSPDRVAAARYRNTPAEMLVKLFNDQDISVRMAAIENPNMPDVSMANPNYHIAKGSNTPPAVLENLARDADFKIRQCVANNSNTPAPVLEYLSKDEYELVRWDVASNPNTPALTLKFLSHDAKIRVRKTAISALRYGKSNS